MVAAAAGRAVAAKRKDGGSIKGLVTPYLEEADAIERNFEAALAKFSKSGDQEEVQVLMSSMADKAKRQHDRLQARLESLGGSRSAGNSFLARSLTFMPGSAQPRYDDPEKNTQHLMLVYSAAAAQMAMYEVLKTVAKAAGDGETGKLAQQLQLEESEDHRLAWEKLPEAARTSSRALLSTV